MTNHGKLAALTLKKEMPIESKKMARVVKPRIRNKRIVVGFWYSFDSRSGSAVTTTGLYTRTR